ncbi:MAG: hypothetical protein SGPRY_011732 [Prymnesium sp.]
MAHGRPSWPLLHKRFHLESLPCVGCTPDPAREGYALVYAGGASAHLGGLRAAVASIRFFDTERTIAIVVTVGSLNSRTNATLQQLQKTFRPLQIVSQPPLAVYDLTGNPLCMDTVVKLVRRFDSLPGAGSEAAASRSAQANYTRVADAARRVNISLFYCNIVLRRWSTGKGRVNVKVKELCQTFKEVHSTLLVVFVNRLREAARNFNLGDAKPSLHNDVNYERPLREMQMFSKFRVWSLWRLNLTRVLYLDTDVLVVQSLQPLWNLHLQPHEFIVGSRTLEHMSTLADEPSCPTWEARSEQTPNREHYAGVRQKFTINAGLYFFRPTQQLETEVLRYLHGPRREQRYRCSNDQSALNAFFSGYIRCMEHTFNCYDPHFLLGEAVEGAERAQEAAVRQLKMHPPRLIAWMQRTAAANDTIRGSSAPIHVRLNRTEINLWAKTEETVFRAACRSYTCTVLRDAFGERTRCLQQHPYALDRDELPGQLFASATARYDISWRAMLQAARRPRPSPQPTPHVLHFAVGFKPWATHNLPLRRSNYFYWLWHAIDEYSAVRLARAEAV